LLADLGGRFGVRIHAYVLMGNHFEGMLWDKQRAGLASGSRKRPPCGAKWQKWNRNCQMWRHGPNVFGG
jgi:hypothetical protein